MTGFADRSTRHLQARLAFTERDSTHRMRIGATHPNENLHASFSTGVFNVESSGGEGGI